MTTTAWVDEALVLAPVARLGTIGDNDVRLVPVCFAVVDGWLVSAVDHKPKRTGQLRRLDDMTANGRATMLIDHYADDWTELWWIRISGRAEVCVAGQRTALDALGALMNKYHQYRENPPTGAVYRIAMDDVRWWRWSGD